MALIKCIECGKDVSEHAKECPSCGCPVSIMIRSQIAHNADTMPQPQTTEVTAEPVVTYAPTAQSNPRPTLSAKESSPAKRILLGIMVLIIAALFIIPILTTISNDQSADYMPQNTYPTFQQNSTLPSKRIHYITSRSVDYDSANNCHRVFFGFTTKEGEYLTGNQGIATITIENSVGEIVYDQKIPFSASDFGTWNNAFWDSSRLLMCVYINNSEITAGASKEGTLTLSVSVDSLNFSAHAMNIYNLPVRGIEISMPQLPHTYSDYDYRNNLEATVRIDGITYDCAVYGPNNVTVTLHVSSTMLFNSTPGVSKYVFVGYKLRNSQGVIVDSGTINIKQSDVGDISLTDVIIWNLSALDTYTLELLNSTD